MKRRIFIPGTLVLAAFAAAFAHLEPGSLSSPKGAGSYAVGAKVNITWIQAEYHRGNYALSFSKNAGTAWESIATWTGPSGDAVTVNYSWTIPNAPGSQTKVRVCQLSNCNDADYVLISPNFTIQAGSAVLDAAPAKDATLRFDGKSRNLEVSFALAEAGPVSLKVFDVRGGLVTTLLDGAHAAGAHSYSLGSASLRGGKALVFRLEAGGRTLTESWTAAR